MNELSKKVCSYFVTAFLTIGFISSVFRVNPSPGPVYENRTLSGPPTASISDLSTYTVQFDRYINDNFGFRLVMIYYYAVFRHFILFANDGENIILKLLGIDE